MNAAGIYITAARLSRLSGPRWTRVVYSRCGQIHTGPGSGSAGKVGSIYQTVGRVFTCDRVGARVGEHVNSANWLAVWSSAAFFCFVCLFVFLL